MQKKYEKKKWGDYDTDDDNDTSVVGVVVSGSGVTEGRVVVGNGGVVVGGGGVVVGGVVVGGVVVGGVSPS